MDNKEFCPLILDSNQCLLLPTETSFTSRKINIRQQNLNEMHPTLNVLYFAEFPADLLFRKPSFSLMSSYYPGLIAWRYKDAVIQK